MHTGFDATDSRVDVVLGFAAGFGSVVDGRHVVDLSTITPTQGFGITDFTSSGAVSATVAVDTHVSVTLA